MASARTLAYRGLLFLGLDDFQALPINTGLQRNGNMGILIKRIELSLHPADFFGQQNNQYVDLSFVSRYDEFSGNQGIPREDDASCLAHFARSLRGADMTGPIDQVLKFDWIAPAGMLVAATRFWLLGQNASDQTVSAAWRVYYSRTKLSEMEVLQLQASR